MSGLKEECEECSIVVSLKIPEIWLFGGLFFVAGTDNGCDGCFLCTT